MADNLFKKALAAQEGATAPDFSIEYPDPPGTTEDPWDRPIPPEGVTAGLGRSRPGSAVPLSSDLRTTEAGDSSLFARALPGHLESVKKWAGVSESELVNVGKAIGREFTDAGNIPFVGPGFAGKEIYDMVQLGKALEAAPEDPMLQARAMELLLEQTKENARSRSSGNFIGSIIGMSAPLGIEMLATGGTGSAVRALGKTLTKSADDLAFRALEDSVTKIVSKKVATAAFDTAASLAAMEGIGQLGSMAINGEDYDPRFGGRITGETWEQVAKGTQLWAEVDPGGTMYAEVAANSPAFAEMLDEGTLSALITVGAERGLGPLSQFGKGLMKLPPLTRVQALYAGTLEKISRKFGVNPQKAGAMLRAAAVTNPAGEFVEELDEAGLRSMIPSLKDDPDAEWWEPWVTADRVGEQLLAFAGMGAAFGAAGGLGRKMERQNITPPSSLTGDEPSVQEQVESQAQSIREAATERARAQGEEDPDAYGAEVQQNVEALEKEESIRPETKALIRGLAAGETVLKRPSAPETGPGDFDRVVEEGLESARRTFPDARRVDDVPEELREVAEVAEDLAEEGGANIVWVEGAQGFEAAAPAEGVFLVNVDVLKDEKRAREILKHEPVHDVGAKHRDTLDETLRRLAEFAPVQLARAMDAYAADFEGATGRPLNLDVALEEGAARLAEVQSSLIDVLGSEEGATFLARVYRENRGLFQKIKEWVQELVQRLTKRSAGGLTDAQKALAELSRQLDREIEVEDVFAAETLGGALRAIKDLDLLPPSMRVGPSVAGRQSYARAQRRQKRLEKARARALRQPVEEAQAEPEAEGPVLPAEPTPEPEAEPEAAAPKPKKKAVKKKRRKKAKPKDEPRLAVQATGRLARGQQALAKNFRQTSPGVYTGRLVSRSMTAPGENQQPLAETDIQIRRWVHEESGASGWSATAVTDPTDIRERTPGEDAVGGELIGDFDSAPEAALAATEYLQALEQEARSEEMAEWEEDEPRFAVRRLRPLRLRPEQKNAPPSFREPNRSWYSKATEVYQDTLEPLKYLQQATRTGRGGELDPARSLELQRGKGRAAIERIQRVYAKPISDLMEKQGISREETGEYLQARHAPERNVVMKIRDPKGRDGLSGWTDKEARDHLAKVHASEKADAYRRLGRLVDRMMRASLKAQREAGLLSAEAYAELSENYPHYVPLRTLETEEAADMLIGVERGKYRASAPIQRAFGRMSRAEPGPTLDFAFHQVALGALAIERAKALQDFLSFARKNPNTKVYAINPIATKKVIGKDGMTKNVPDLEFAQDPAVVLVPEDGKLVKIQFAPAYVDVARAINTFGASDLGLVLSFIRPATRFISGIYTRWNPVFPAFNLLRDVSFAGFRAEADSDVGMKLARYMASGSASRTVLAGMRGKDTVGGKRPLERAPEDWQQKPINRAKWARYYHEWEMAGGPQTVLDLENVEQKQRELERQVSRIGKAISPLKVVASLVMDSLETVNDLFENQTRFGYYVALRETGTGVEQAAIQSKDLTTNFERRGHIGAFLSSLIAFANAGIQGTDATWKTIKRPKAQKMLAAAMTFAVMNDMMNVLLAPDDDDGENLYKKRPEFEKRTNLFIYNPLAGEDGPVFITIPLPHVLRGFHYAAIKAAEVIRGEEEPGTAVAHIVEAMMEDTLPVDPLDPKTWAPTILRPFFEIEANKNWLDKPIYPAFDKSKPDSERFWEETGNPALVSLMREINSVTGGDEFKEGRVSISPESVEHLIENLGGGLLKTLERAQSTISRAAAGEPFSMETVPLLRRLVYHPSEGSSAFRYREHRNSIELLKKRMKKAQEDRDSKAAQEIRNDPLYPLAGRLKATESALRRAKGDAEKETALHRNFNRIAAERLKD